MNRKQLFVSDICKKFITPAMKKVGWNKRKESEIAWKVSGKEIKERNYDINIKNPHGEEDETPHSALYLLDMLESSFAKSTGLIQKLRGKF